MWTTAKISDIQNTNGKASVVVVAQDDQTQATVQETFFLDGNSDNLKRGVQNWIDRLNAVATLAASLSKDAVIDKPSSAPATDLQKFVIEFSAYRRLGLVFGDGDQRTIDQLKKAQSLWADGYEYTAMI